MASSCQVLPVTTDAQRRAWDEFATTSSVGHMHQCLWWAEPLSRYGVRSEALACWVDDRLMGGALFRSVPVPFTTMTVTECLNGPIFLDWESTWADLFVRELAELPRALNSIAVVMKGCPRRDVHTDIVSAFGRAGLEATLTPGVVEAIVALEGRSLNDILKNFKNTTKSGLKKSQKRTEHVRRLTTPEDLSEAYAAWMATAARRGFSDIRPWPALQPVLRHCVANGLGSVLGSFAEERLLAAIFVAHVGKTATWVYSGYMDGCGRYNPTHRLVYEAIRESLEKEMSAYSLGNLISDGARGRSGVDEFKLGFGALPHRHLDTITWERRPLVYRLLETLRHGWLGRRVEALLRRHLIRSGDATPDHLAEGKARAGKHE